MTKGGTGLRAAKAAARAIVMAGAFMAGAYIAAKMTAGAAVTNRVLTVDQDGNVSSTAGLATQADLAAVAASNRIAMAEQSAAADGYRATTNLLNAVAQSVLVAPVVYMGVELTGFEAAVAFDEDSKVHVTAFRPNVREVAVDGTACMESEIDFAFQEELQTVKPLVEYSQMLGTNAPRSAWGILQDAYVTTPQQQAGSYTDAVGNVYHNLYTMGVRIPKAEVGDRAFFGVSVPNDAAEDDGTVYEMPGVKGGYSGTVEWGGKTLTFKGGYLTGVTQ